MILFLKFFFIKKTLFIEFHHFLLYFLFFMHDLQKHVAIVLCFQILFWKISWFFCLNLFVSVQKKNTSKKKVTLFIFLYFSFLICSLFRRIFMFTLLVVSLLIFHTFSLFLFFLFSLSMFPLLMFASRYVYLLSLSLVLLLFFFEKSPLFTFRFFQKKILHLFIPFCKTVFVLFPLLFRSFFLLFFFQTSSFEQDKLTLFSFGRKTICLIPPRTYFLKFCHLMFEKVFHRFFDFSLKSFFWKIWFFWIS